MTWDEYFVHIGHAVRAKSKDPSSKIGAILVGADKQIISTGFNGFPRGIDETDLERWERPLKYSLVSHAERNAIENAARTGICTKGAVLYLIGFGPPTVPCIECTKSVIQAGIVEVVGYAYKPNENPNQWDLDFSLSLLKEAGIKVREVDF